MKTRYELNSSLYHQKIYENHSAVLLHFLDVQNGDTESVRIKLQNGEIALNPDMRMLSGNADRNLMYHFVDVASAAARACMEGGMSCDEAYALSDLYIRKADLCREQKAIFRLFGEMCLDFAERMQEIRKFSVISLHIRKCIDYIYGHLHGDLSRNALAELTGLHPSYLSRLFAKETGKTIHQFVTDARVDTAQNQLKYSDLSYSEISEALGFSSQSAFIHTFRNAIGMTPKQFREAHYQKH